MLHQRVFVICIGDLVCRLSVSDIFTLCSFDVLLLLNILHFACHSLLARFYSSVEALDAALSPSFAEFTLDSTVTDMNY